MEKESFTVLEFVEVLYHTILFLHVVKELNVLENKLSVFEEQIRKDVLRQYLFTVTE